MLFLGNGARPSGFGGNNTSSPNRLNMNTRGMQSPVRGGGKKKKKKNKGKNNAKLDKSELAREVPNMNFIIRYS